MDKRINIENSFKLLYYYWKVLGFYTGFNKYLMLFYDIFVSCIATIAFPAHLLLGIIYAENGEIVFINGTIAIAAIACSIKHFLLRQHLNEIPNVVDVLRQLDERVQKAEDTQYYIKYIWKRSIHMTYFFTIVYFAVFFLASLTALWTGSLLYPAFVILDWQDTKWKYWLIVIFQMYGLNMQIVQNLTNDAYGPIAMCALSGQVHLLARRIARIGHADIGEGNFAESYSSQLVACIEDYTLLFRTTRLLERIISHSYMVQFIAVGINVVVGLFYLLFYADNLLSYIYYIFHIVAIMSELFPCCYYGSMVQAEFHALSYAIFRSNWLTQPRLFRRNIVIFAQLSLKDVTVSAGGMMRIHIDSFFKTAKMGYSLFTVVQSIKQ
ncbi:odorant receptor 33b-like [Eurosta solidaginis]|uniref:odorant receptor 33b-like n=1 Tax=Eurosta solidaginis TaxID=178769 RepID=UPI0035316EBF